MTIASGTKLGRYEIRSKIGEGGMGEVYLAQDLKLDRKVALKVLPAEVAANHDRMRRFTQEAKSAAGLNHSNIAHIYEIGDADGVHFIAMEFIDGVTLRARMRQSEIKLSEVLDVAVQIASALSAAHTAGVVHRDIKPENIMVRRDGFVKVLDFGLAKLTERLPPESVDTEAPTSFKTDPGTVVGTAVYMSPEQARGLDVDARTDIFSLGVLVYEMVSGRLPSGGSNINEILASILSDKEPSPLVRYAHDVPAELERIVAKALRKEREKRYQTTKDLLLDLQSLKQQLDFEARLEHSIPPETRDAQTMAAARSSPTQSGETAQTIPITESLARRIKQHKRGVAIALAVLLLTVTAGYWFLIHRSAGVTPIESIAVLPFVNESGTPDVEYLSDGMTESLIDSLSQLPHLAVKARTSVFRYKGKEIDPQQVASQLSVQAILNGRVVQRGDDLTLYLSLVDARNGNQIWGEQYNRKLKDLLVLQGEIARDVSQKLQARLSSADEQKLTKNYTANMEAYQLYLRGRYHVFKMTLPEAQTGISYFQQAIEIDPNYALAYVGLANAYRSFAISGDMPTEFFPKAKDAAQKAVEIDDRLAEAHAVLGFTIFWYDWNWNQAEIQLKRALELDPNSADARWFYGTFLSSMGRDSEALNEVKRARELDPLNPIIGAGEGQFLIHGGRPDEALASLQKTIELEPKFWFAHMLASDAYTEKGMFTEAGAEARKATELSGANSHSLASLGYALARSGKQAEARAVLDELLKVSTERHVSAHNVALVYNGLGQRDEALAWLERAFEQRDPRMVFLKVEPKWNNLRADPRFQDLLRRVGL